jgi:hypothetical protein
VFQGAREQVVLAALRERSWFAGDQLAQASGTSTFTVSTTLAELDRLEWLEARGTGNTLERRLSQPGLLLDAWARAWREREQSGKQAVGRYYRYGSTHKLMAWLAKELSELQMAGENQSIEWAFTGACAANLLAPHLTSVDAVDLILPPGTLSHVAAALGLEEVEEGHNLRLLERSGAAFMFPERLPSRELSGTRFANRYIQYLDLLDGRGRHMHATRSSSSSSPTTPLVSRGVRFRSMARTSRRCRFLTARSSGIGIGNGRFQPNCSMAAASRSRTCCMLI